MENQICLMLLNCSVFNWLFSKINQACSRSQINMIQKSLLNRESLRKRSKYADEKAKQKIKLFGQIGFTCTAIEMLIFFRSQTFNFLSTFIIVRKSLRKHCKNAEICQYFIFQPFNFLVSLSLNKWNIDIK